MAKKQAVQSGLVSKNVLAVAVVIAFVLGAYVGGTGMSLYLSESNTPKAAQGPSMSPVPPQGMGAPQGMPPQGMPPQGMGQPQGGSSEHGVMTAALEEEVSLHPENVRAWTQLGNAYYDSNMFEKAIRAYKRSLELNPADANVWTDLGVMYRRSGQPQKAVEAFESAILNDGKHEIAWFNKGLVLMHDMEDAQAAVRTWEKLAEINPNAKTPNGQPLKELIEKLK
ncbi:MAG: tetratricopeptide repeat protein [Thermodesulfobacteriota bacterium]|nr:tetratricopeptide repeat protein [Thermodesulfobacteriota bacterium]